MGARGTTFGKMERERAKKAKAATKRARREERAAESEAAALEPPVDDDGLGTLSASALLALVEKTHNDFEAGLIGFDEFEEKKAELLARLPID